MMAELTVQGNARFVRSGSPILLKGEKTSGWRHPESRLPLRKPASELASPAEQQIRAARTVTMRFSFAEIPRPLGFFFRG
jgi:hypothetical protein